MSWTKIQRATLVALVAYAIYEGVFVTAWRATLPPGDPIIRADLIFLYPLLLLLLFISVAQAVWKNVVQE